ncbi:thiamine phosphate synthase [Chitinophaga qingshengii]|uniref:Thiamine-phosphate synthase n=1 Tax=Chitinophaga qingshengii TaxID=1569794 RepID=A0ABR7TNH9_9BACT|nr:thiamine phosphate synthase [Chitinophaga qingshengii]MBC9931545.1 thiamine phosphate synthase [Chitinophaga qingshengii]
MISKLHYISQQTGQRSHLDNIRAACEAGCQWIQLRIKNETPENILPVATAAKTICDEYNASLIINDYPHIAVAVNAAGVHVGLQDMTVAEARAIVGPGKIVGGTANTLSDVLSHVKNGASYVGLGPFRFTTTKQNLSPILGVEGYHSIMTALREQQINTPVVAIGGIMTTDIPAILETGIHGVAVSGLITQAPEQQPLVQHIYELLNKQ